jgi:hypothetical protein
LAQAPRLHRGVATKPVTPEGISPSSTQLGLAVDHV